MSITKKSCQFGLWKSPITPLSMARGINFGGISWTRDGSLVWLEQRGDRSSLVIAPPDGQAPRELASEFSVRARVGYGGGDFAIGIDCVYFVAADSGRIYRQSLNDGVPYPVTPAFGKAASPSPSPDGQWLIFVHTYEDRDCLLIVDAEGHLFPQKLVEGEDFYMQPAWHPDSNRIAWVSWNHPNMPWDGATLKLGFLSMPAKGKPGLPVIENVTVVDGNEHVAIFQPEFSPDGKSLVYASDAGDWWQLYLYNLERGEKRQLTFAPADHAVPAWIQGMRTFAFRPDGESIVFLRIQDGSMSLWEVNLNSGQEQRLPISSAYSYFEQLSIIGNFSKASDSSIAVIGSGSATPPRVITVTSGNVEKVWQRASSEEISSNLYSIPKPVLWNGMDGETVYGLCYQPQSIDFVSNGLPPLIVVIHGGPTSQAYTGFNLRNQFFTSRGYAVLEVNHRGSTGYGRPYRDKLRGMWGIYDVQDAVSGARELARLGWVDEKRMVILGGSAGGFTVLKTLEDYPGCFKAGVCLYGVSNQFTLAAESHKFEAHYSDSLLGVLPEAADIYRERSPIFFMNKICDPLAIYQGEDDQVVPRQQSDDVAAELRRRGIPHIYHVYPGEGHGFRKPETIEHYYQTVEQFLRQHVIFS